MNSLHLIIIIGGLLVHIDHHLVQCRPGLVRSLLGSEASAALDVILPQQPQMAPTKAPQGTAPGGPTDKPTTKSKSKTTVSPTTIKPKILGGLLGVDKLVNTIGENFNVDASLDLSDEKLGSILAPLEPLLGPLLLPLQRLLEPATSPLRLVASPVLLIVNLLSPVLGPAQAEIGPLIADTLKPIRELVIGPLAQVLSPLRPAFDSTILALINFVIKQVGGEPISSEEIDKVINTDPDAPDPDLHDDADDFPALSPGLERRDHVSKPSHKRIKESLSD